MKSLEDQVFLFLNKYIPEFPSTSITVALSMGSDSMALFFILYNLKKKYDFHLSAAHLNHGIRKESLLEQNEFINLMQKLGIPFYTDSIKLPNNLKNSSKSFENWAREERLKFYVRAKNELRSDYIATAHNKDDVVETFFLNLLRGTGLIGASSIQPKRDYIIRPVLEISKNELLNYLILNKINFFEDKTNKDNKINRNYIRNILLKKINTKFPGSVNSILSFIREINSTLNFLDSFLPDWFFKNLWNVDNFEKLPDYLKSFFLYRKLKDLSQTNAYEFNILNINHKMIDDCLLKINNIKNGYIARFSIFDIYIAYNNLYFVFKKNIKDSKIEFNLRQSNESKRDIIIFNQFLISINLENKVVANNSTIDYKNGFLIKRENLNEKLYFTSWEKGDKIKLPNGYKKLQDIFTDWKIPKPLRKDLVVIRNEKDLIGFYLPYNFGNKSNYILSKEYYVDFNKKNEYIFITIGNNNL